MLRRTSARGPKRTHMCSSGSSQGIGLIMTDSVRLALCSRVWASGVSRPAVVPTCPGAECKEPALCRLGVDSLASERGASVARPTRERGRAGQRAGVNHARPLPRTLLRTVSARGKAGARDLRRLPTCRCDSRPAGAANTAADRQRSGALPSPPAAFASAAAHAGA